MLTFYLKLIISNFCALAGYSDAWSLAIKTKHVLGKRPIAVSTNSMPDCPGWCLVHLKIGYRHAKKMPMRVLPAVSYLMKNWKCICVSHA